MPPALTWLRPCRARHPLAALKTRLYRAGRPGQPPRASPNSPLFESQRPRDCPAGRQNRFRNCLLLVLGQNALQRPGNADARHGTAVRIKYGPADAPDPGLVLLAIDGVAALADSLQFPVQGARTPRQQL